MDDDLNELLGSAGTLTAARDEGRASREDRDLERRLRQRIRRRLAATPCVCACGDGPYECECGRCRASLHNGGELSALARERRAERGAVVPVALGDVEAFAGVLARVSRDGEQGANFAIADVRGMEGVFVQFAGSPREATMLWEAAAIDVTLLEGGEEMLAGLGFAAPGAGHASPNYGQEVALGDEPDATLVRLTTGSFQLLREVYGCPPDAILDVSLHMGAWAD